MTGVGAMVRAGAWAEVQLGMTVLSIGSEGSDRKDSCCTLDVCGRHLFYRIKLDGERVWLSACRMDSGNEPELLLTVGDEQQGWRKVCCVVRLLEREEVRRLERPIELGGGSGPDGLVIG
jgi:hypothetical protein